MTERSYDKGYDDTRYDQARRESGRFGRYLSTRSPETWMFFVAGVFLFDDAAEVARLVTHDAAVAGRVFQHRRGEGRRGVLVAVRLHELGDGRGLDERAVAAEHQDIGIRIALEEFGGLHHRVFAAGFCRLLTHFRVLPINGFS